MAMAKRPEKIVELKEFGGEKVLIKGAMGNLRWRILEEALAGDDGAKMTIVIAKLFPAIAIECMFDPESGEPAYKPEDEKMLDGVGLKPRIEVLDHIVDLSGLKEEAIETGKAD